MDLAKFKHDYKEAINNVVENAGLTAEERREVRGLLNCHDRCLFQSIECRMVELATYLIGVTSSLYEDWQIFETGYEYRTEQSALDIATLANKNEELKKVLLEAAGIGDDEFTGFWVGKSVDSYAPASIAAVSAESVYEHLLDYYHGTDDDNTLSIVEDAWPEGMQGLEKEIEMAVAKWMRDTDIPLRETYDWTRVD